MQDYKEEDVDLRGFDKSHFDGLQLDDALLMFSKTGISERRPRSTTGQIHVDKAGPVVVCKTTDRLATLLQVLSTENIMGCPIINEREVCVGDLGWNDVVSYCCNVLAINPPASLQNTIDNENDIQQDGVTWIKTCISKFGTLTCNDLLHYTRELCQQDYDTRGCMAWFTRQTVIPEGHSLLTALELLVHTRSHRLAVCNNQGKVCGIYTTSMALSDLRQSMHLLKNWSQLPVSSCMTREVVTLPITSRAIDAFMLMAKKNLSGIALTDEHGKLTGNISLRDFRGCGPDGQHFSRLFLRLCDYKDVTRKEYPNLGTVSHWSGQNVPQGARYVDYSEACLSDCIRALNDGNLSRVLVMNNDKLVGIVTQRDLVRCLLQSLGCYEY